MYRQSDLASAFMAMPCMFGHLLLNKKELQCLVSLATPDYWAPSWLQD